MEFLQSYDISTEVTVRPSHPPPMANHSSLVVLMKREFEKDETVYGSALVHFLEVYSKQPIYSPCIFFFFFIPSSVSCMNGESEKYGGPLFKTKKKKTNQEKDVFGNKKG